MLPPNHPAEYWRPLDDGRVECELCPHRCRVADGDTGICDIRTNNGGELFATEYGRTCAVAMDPIEKKPLYHYHPGDDILSIGVNGCNFKCLGCQNFHISQEKSLTEYVSAEEMVELAVSRGSPGIAYTYTEPLIWFEYIRDCMKLGNERGVYGVIVSNGYVEEKPLEELTTVLGAANIDVKSIRDDFYKKYCGARLEPVLRTCKILKENGVHLEVTNLLVTDMNDSEEDVTELVAWILENLGRETPVHFSRYFPYREMDAPATPVHRMLRAKEIAERELYYVYLGNVGGVGGSDTSCPECANVLVERAGYSTRITGITDDRKCSDCGRAADFVL
jgi:pyruvate formate lyase activating enzyme